MSALEVLGIILLVTIGVIFYIFLAFAVAVVIAAGIDLVKDFINWITKKKHISHKQYKKYYNPDYTPTKREISRVCAYVNYEVSRTINEGYRVDARIDCQKVLELCLKNRNVDDSCLDESIKSNLEKWYPYLKFDFDWSQGGDGEPCVMIIKWEEKE